MPSDDAERLIGSIRREWMQVVTTVGNGFQHGWRSLSFDDRIGKGEQHWRNGESARS
jgi:hypothetical protein